MRPSPATRRRRREDGRRSGWPTILGVAVLALSAVIGAVTVVAWLRQSPAGAAGRADSGGLPAAVERDANGQTPASRGRDRLPGLAQQAPVPPSRRSTGKFDSPSGDGTVLGNGGRLYRLRIAVEDGSGVEVEEFTNLVETTLGDRRSWVGTGSVRFQRAAKGPIDLTIHLATPQTAEKLCVAGGISTIIDGVPYTSCRVGNNVVVNLDRYLNGVQDYRADIGVYRQYVINHEVGHFLGRGHETCPGSGKLAPVMQQQTLGLAGCVANSWPHVGGRLYSGPAVGD